MWNWTNWTTGNELEEHITFFKGGRIHWGVVVFGGNCNVTPLHHLLPWWFSKGSPWKLFKMTRFLDILKLGKLVYSVSMASRLTCIMNVLNDREKSRSMMQFHELWYISHVCKRVECTCCGLLCWLHCSGRSSISSHQGAARISDTLDSFFSVATIMRFSKARQTHIPQCPHFESFD